MTPHRIEVCEGYWLGEHFSNSGWDRLTLLRERRNRVGSGSMSWPVAYIDIVDHPPLEGCNSHTEITISIRNNIRRNGDAIDVDKNATELRHPEDILDTQVLDDVVTKLKELGVARDPLSVYTCMRHVEDFRVEGNFWREDN